MTVPEPRDDGPGPKGRALFLGYWLPVAAYIALIFLLSSVQGSQLPGTFPFMDKTAHLLEYALFGLLVGRAIRFTLSGGRAVAVVLGTIAIGAAVGLLDEIYQSTVPGRWSDPLDWLTDVGAVATAVVITQLIRARPLRGRNDRRLEDKGR